jgi:hypothetical protein
MNNYNHEWYEMSSHPGWFECEFCPLQKHGEEVKKGEEIVDYCPSRLLTALKCSEEKSRIFGPLNSTADAAKAWEKKIRRELEEEIGIWKEAGEDYQNMALKWHNAVTRAERAEALNASLQQEIEAKVQHAYTAIRSEES